MKTILLFLITILISNYSSAQSNGSIDSVFGNNGLVTTKYNTQYSCGFAITHQDDGKIIVGGLVSINSTNKGVIIRYNSNGILDSTFGTNGFVIDSAISIVRAVFIQEDGKILIAGSSAIVRYYSNGTIDQTFGENGKALCLFTINTLTVQSDDKIIVSGYSELNGGKDYALARFNSNGIIDSAFGVNGTVISFPSDAMVPNDQEVKKILIQKDGKIVVVGGGAYSFSALRYTMNGTLDSTFGEHGVFEMYNYNYQFTESGALLEDDKIIISGWIDKMRAGFAMLRCTKDGLLDKTFGNNGIVEKYVGLDAPSYSVIIQPNKKLLLGGGGSGQMVFMQFNSDGIIDSSFGNQGIGILHSTPSCVAYSITTQSDGKILATGTNGINLIVVRFYGDLTVNITNKFIKNEMKIYPNPTSNNLTIEIKSPARIELFNINGQILFSQTNTQTTQTIDLTSYLSGIYFLKITGADFSETSKIIKQ